MAGTSCNGVVVVVGAMLDVVWVDDGVDTQPASSTRARVNRMGGMRFEMFMTVLAKRQRIYHRSYIVSEHLLRQFHYELSR